MKHLLPLLLVCGFLTSGFVSADTSQDCADKIGSCEYYQCRESVLHCGEEGYLLRFGYNYCTRFFNEVTPNVSDEEKAWLDRVGSCLQTSVQKLPLEWSCNQIEDQAIAEHSECYIQTGFCEMPFSLRFRLFSVVYTELKDERIFDAFIKIIERCDFSESL